MKPTRLPLAVVPGAHCLVALPLSLHAVEPPAVLEITLAAEGSSALLFFAGWGGAASASQQQERAGGQNAGYLPGARGARAEGTNRLPIG